MVKITFLGSMLLLIGSTMNATTFSSSCVVAGFATVTGTDSCLSDPYNATNGGREAADGIPLAEVQSSLSVSSGTVAIVQTDSVATTFGTATTLPPMGSTSSKIDGSITYATGGAVRSGFIQTNFKLVAASNYTGVGDQSYSLSMNGSQMLYGDCFLSGSSNSCVQTHGSGLIPFQLGVPFTVAITASLTAEVGGYGNSIRSLDNMASTFSFQLFEADGTTAVLVDDPATAPEPVTYVLVGAGMAIVGVSRRRSSWCGKRQ